MSFLRAFTKVVDAVNRRIGMAASWLILLAIIISAGNAVIRKLFDVSSNAWLDLQWFLFAAVFILCSPWTLMDDQHIRIDIVNMQLKKRTRDCIDVFGHLVFLLPFAIIVLLTSWPLFVSSASIGEQSMNAGGLPVWPAKALIPLGFFLLTLQGVSQLIKSVRAVRSPEALSEGDHKTEVEQAMERHRHEFPSSEAADRANERNHDQ